MTIRSSEERQTHALASWLPDGDVWAAARIDDTVTRRWIQAFAVEHHRKAVELERFIGGFPADALCEFLDEYESELGLPDACFPASTDFATRLTFVQMKLASLAAQTGDDWVAIAAILGITVTVQGGIGSVLYPGPTFASDKAARNAVVVTFIGLPSPNVFPFTFPFTFEEAQSPILECLFTELKPSNCTIHFIFD